MQADRGAARPWPFWFLVATLVGLLLVFLPVALGHPTVLSGDPRLYGESMALMFSGQIPYIDFSYEHLPLAIGPMAVAHVLAAATGIGFGISFAVLMLVAAYLSGVLVQRIAGDLGLGDIGVRWVVMMAPMLLIMPFRIDAFSVLLAVAALSYAIRGREQESFAAAIGGILAKGWPVVLAAADWWRGRRRRFVGLVGFTVVVGALLLATPGFREGRSFVGVHEETVSGSLIIFLRFLLGESPMLTNSAGAVYVETGHWALALNLAIGAALALAALTVLRRRFSWPGGIALTAALTYAVLLASPLLSTQFLLWPIPFLALTGSRPSRWLLTAAAAMSVALTGFWFPGELWWHTGWLLRNAVLLAAAISAVRDALTVAAAYEESTSLRNLPV